MARKNVNYGADGDLQTVYQYVYYIFRFQRWLAGQRYPTPFMCGAIERDEAKLP